jgi:hypothetical protein
MKMNTNDIQLEELRRRMEEAALFAPEDPVRQAMVREISQLGGGVEQEWMDILQENERLRIDLARVNPPPGLQERLLAIPEQNHPRMRWWFRPPLLSPRWIGAVAALLAVAFGLIALLGQWEPRQARAVQTVASLAMASHEAYPQLQIASSDWGEIERSIDREFRFEIQRPDMPPDVELVGAAVTTLAGSEVLYTRWREPGGVYCSVYQFCARDFDLKRPLPRQAILPGVGDIDGRPFEVIVWSEGHCDYALVRKAAPREAPQDQQPLQVAAAL